MLAIRLPILSVVASLACFVSACCLSEVPKSSGQGRIAGDLSACKPCDIARRAFAWPRKSASFISLLLHFKPLSGWLARGLGRCPSLSSCGGHYRGTCSLFVRGKTPQSNKNAVDIDIALARPELSGLALTADDVPQDGALTSTQAIKSFYNAFNEGDLDSLASFITDDCEYLDLLFGDYTSCRGKAVFLSKMRFHPFFWRGELGIDVPRLTKFFDSSMFEVLNICADEDKVMVEWHVVNGGESNWASRGLSLLETDPARGGKIKRVVDISAAPWRLVGQALSPIANSFLSSKEAELDMSTREREYEYELHLKTVLADGQVTQGERAYLEVQAYKLNVSAERHSEMLKCFGWSQEEYLLGCRRADMPGREFTLLEEGLKKRLIKQAAGQAKKALERRVEGVTTRLMDGTTPSSPCQADLAFAARQTVHRFYEVINRRDDPALASLLTSDCVYEDLFLESPRYCRGKQDFLKTMPMQPSSFNRKIGRYVTYDIDTIVANENMVGVEWHVRQGGDIIEGGHGLSLLQIDPATGKIKRIVDVSEKPWRFKGFPAALIADALSGNDAETQRVAEYALKLRTVLADEQVTRGEREHLTNEALRLNISEKKHQELLESEHWTLSEYVDGRRGEPS